MKVSSAKNKGRRLQQKIVSDLLRVFPSLAKDDVKSCSMGANGEDVQLSHAARQVFPYSIEAKNQERVNIWTAIAQAEANATKGADALVVFKKNNEDPRVVLRWELFLSILSKSYEPSHVETGNFSRAQPVPATEDEQFDSDPIIANLRFSINVIEAVIGAHKLASLSPK